MSQRTQARDGSAASGVGAFAVGAIMLAAGLGAYSTVRLIDADEGYLLLAARLVGEGKVPYRDFFFPQGPLFPYAYGMLLPSGWGWYSARALSSFFGITTGFLTMLSVRRQGGTARAQLLCAVVMTTAALSFAWLTIAKTYAVSAACLVGAHAASVGERRHFVGVARTRWESWRGFGIGCLLSLAVTARPHTIVAAPLVLLHYRQSGGRLWEALAGFVAGCLPWLPLFLGRPSNVLYGLVEYHLSRSTLGTGQSLRQKLDVMLILLGLKSPERALGLQFDIVVALAILGTFVKRPRRWCPALSLSLVLAAASLALTPTHVQYFALIFPFMTEAACLGLDEVDARFSRVSSWSVFGVAAAIACLGVAEAWRYAASGRSVPGITSPERASNWSIPEVERVGRAADLLGRGPALTEWPGYLVGTSVQPVAGAENHFSIPVAERAGDAARRRALHLSTKDELERQSDMQRVPLIITGNATEWKVGERAYQNDGYELRASVGGASIWQAASRGPASDPANTRSNGAESAGDSSRSPKAD